MDFFAACSICNDIYRAGKATGVVKKRYSIAVMEGDGIGPEVVKATLRVLESVREKFHFRLDYRFVPAGDSALRKFGDALPENSVEAFASSDACLKGPVGESVRIINDKLRFGFDLYANLRPARSYPGICPPALRPNIDLTVIRENSEGFYRALESRLSPGLAITTGVFTSRAAERIADFAFRYARNKVRRPGLRPAVTLATKANIFPETHGMYLSAFEKLSRRYRQIRFEHCYADAMCALLVRSPERFDVIVSENLLADLLSDLAGQVAGGLGMTPGTNINYETRHAYFEPTHGCAPDIAGKGIADPIGQIRSGALMLEYLGTIYADVVLRQAAIAIEDSIGSLLNDPNRSILPRELGGKSGSRKVTDAVISRIEEDQES
jgi:3-isopropylmalate dehydrogenase